MVVRCFYNVLVIAMFYNNDNKENKFDNTSKWKHLFGLDLAS